MKRMIGLFLVFLVTLNSVAAFAATVDASRIKSEIAKRGTGEKARVRITTRDHAQLSGYISEIGDSTFIVSFKHPSGTRTFSYSDVVKVSGPGLSKPAKIGIGVGAGVVLGTGIAAAVIFAKCGICR